ncbi:unnamed protein product [Adineta ricciae]|uniref:Rhodanese domain-containing protein n=1 Tax=Adineta ricciae TaxID=249248 RepID=A0A813PGN4_ADIRI|nr:unnamed protein product [Adineta ricciae]
MSLIRTNRPKPPVNILDKRIPRNPRYENVQTTIDTGDSLTNALKRSEESRGYAKPQAGELFKRMKISTLIKLIIQVAEINSLENESRNTDRPETQDSQMSAETTRSTLQTVIRGVGEMDIYRDYMNRNSTIPVTPKTANSDNLELDFDERPYLIVDLRDIDEFNTNHIVSAHHYPAAMLSRCSNNESKELLIYKNKKGKIIVLYDEDEQIAPRAATIMSERGYNNIFLLSGGLKYAVRKYPCGLITGRCPLSWTLSETQTRPVKVHNCVQPSDHTSHHHDDALSTHRTVVHSTKALQDAMVTFDTREQFTSHDIEELNEQYEAHLLPKDSGTRLSRTQTHASKQSSRISNASDRSNFSHISDKPWKP